MEPFVFEWKMPLTKYKECQVKERLWSVSYTTPQYLPLKFYLRLFPHGDDEENKEFISYFLFCEPPNGHTITLIYNLYIQDETGRRIAESPWEGEFGVKHQTWGKRRFCRRPIISAGSDDNRYLTFGCKVEVKNFDPEIFVPKVYPSVPVEDDEEEAAVASNGCEVSRDIDPILLTMIKNPHPFKEQAESEDEEIVTKTEVKEKEDSAAEDSGLDNKAADAEDEHWSDDEEDSVVSSVEEPKPKVLSKLGGKIAALYPSMEISDVTLVVAGEDIKAHKLILFLHSPCLAAMIKQDEWDSATTKIDVEGFAPITVHKALEYMYTESIADVQKLEVHQMMELSRFATMFTISDLKEFINHQIISSVNTSTACELANLSMEYKEDVIHETALDFITKNLQHVKLDESFAQLSGENAKAILRML